ncbi:efflux RND transporter permease subunit [Anatilimnocola floriformis]|uniref:efflux RND transporter permease subunit n=1 Tax=Anatilimnocola floriformis TaxID=2948575 RepID=UPI0020C20286|nr:MMPL family transporter [Anatilimnocola floriformis]
MTEKPTFFSRRAIIVLMVVFFLVPFFLRGARLGIQGMKNDVRDWLPKDFEETKELAWFRQHFLGEQFVVLSWQGCVGDETDERYKLFLAKLQPETPPSVLAAAKAPKKPVVATEESESPDADATANEVPVSDAPAADAVAADAAPVPSSPTRHVHRENFIGDRLGLYMPLDGKKEFLTYEDWGHRGEKWLKGRKDPDSESVEECWYYLTPEGDLYRWDGVDAPLASLYRHVYGSFVKKPTTGELVHSFGEIDGPWYFADMRRLRAQMFKTVTTGPDVYASMTGEGGELADHKAEAKRRLSGMLFGPDGKQTAIVVTLSEAAKHNLHLVLGRGILGKPRGRLFELAAESNIDENQLRVGGPSVDNVAIDEEGSITLVRLIGMTAVLGLGLSYACFRTISATIMVFFCGGICAVFTLACMWWFGSTVDAIAMSLPALVYVLGLSGATHLINYYYEAVDHGGVHGAPERAVLMGWKPNLMCNITTSIGMFSLVTSELIPIQKFGFYAGLGVLSATLIEFTYLPAALQIWPQLRKQKIAQERAARNLSTDEQPWLDKYLANFWSNLATFIVGHHALVSLGCILVIAVTGYGVLYTKTSVNMLRMFSAKSKIIQDYEWLEKNLGELVPMEVVVSVPKTKMLPAGDQLQAEYAQIEQLSAALENANEEQKQGIATELGKLERQQLERQLQMPFLERMELAARLQRVVEKEFGLQGRDKVGRAMSAATFVRDLPEPKGDNSSQLKRGTTSKRLEAHREDFLHSDYLRIDKETEAELWRVSLRVGATKGVDYGVLINELKDVVEPILTAQRKRDDILHSLITRSNGHKYPANSKVLLLGVPADISQRAAKNAVAVESEEKVVATAPQAEKPIDQTRIFSESLIDMLTIKRMKVKTFVPGVDETPANWNEYLAGFDCVVLVKDHAAFANVDLRRTTKLLEDARNHVYSDANKLLSSSKLAKTDKNIAHAVYTGVVPIVYKAQRSLLESLISSTWWSFVTITPLLMFVSRSFWGGLVAMLPNVLPVLVIFGMMGWLGVDVDVGSMMTASIALGVAVDDTIHYLNWYREELDRVKDRKLAILGAYKHCATPTFQAALISGLGLSLFALSTFTPTQRFGYLMLAILWAGVVAELIFFPALLAGPLGVVFKPRNLAADAPAEEHPPVSTSSITVITQPAEERAVPAPAGKAALLNHLRQDVSHGRKH